MPVHTEDYQKQKVWAGRGAGLALPQITLSLFTASSFYTGCSREPLECFLRKEIEDLS